MTGDNVLVWPVGKEWPASLLPPPCLTIELSVLELETLISHHDEFAVRAHRVDHNHDTGLFHEARASYMRQRLAVIAPERLTPERKGRA